MSDTLANVIARINHLRTLAGNNTNENEAAAAAAAAAAAKLIARHQLSEMDLQLKGEKGAEPIEQCSEPLYKTGRAMYWVGFLAMTLCEHYGCTGYWNHVADPEEVFAKNPDAVRDSYKAFMMVGRKSDMEVVRYMFTWLQPVIVYLMKSNASGRGMKYSQNYASGVVQGIKNQLKLEHKKTQEEAAVNNQSQAMVLLDSRLTLSQEHLKATVKGLHSKRSHLGYDPTARASGIKAGENIRLTKGIAAAPNNKLLT